MEEVEPEEGVAVVAAAEEGCRPARKLPFSHLLPDTKPTTMSNSRVTHLGSN